MHSIRQANLTDLQQITQWTIALQQHEDSGELVLHEHFQLNIQRWLENEFANPNSLFLVAQNIDKPVGFILASSTINDNGLLKLQLKGIIQLLWVDPAYRHQQHARNLVNQVIACFQEIGIEYAECTYTANNQMAHQFWSSMGFAPCAISARKLFSATN
ncbi:GNAT family N-acetyltransferase [Aliikangiella maris]|uniref:GNAT family N-acetyltransferase n=2 Tax=Aliikangiella maris TaxID=3162458 RepID=A0ABV2BSW4_9GAMM